MSADSPFGLCPICHKTGGFLNVGRSQRSYCKEHQEKSCVEGVLFDSWKHQTEAEQRARCDAVGLGQLKELDIGMSGELPRRQRPVALAPRITEAGRKEHRDYIKKTIKDPIWHDYLKNRADQVDDAGVTEIADSDDRSFRGTRD
jgi:hypothetical protein